LPSMPVRMVEGAPILPYMLVVRPHKILHHNFPMRHTLAGNARSSIYVLVTVPVPGMLVLDHVPFIQKSFTHRRLCTLSESSVLRAFKL